MDKNNTNKNTEKELELAKKKEIAEWIVSIVVGVVVAVFINQFILINAKVPSASMENNIMTGDRLFGYRLAYINEEPQRGDIVIFKYPDDERQLFIKRVIGLPGDTVIIIDGKVYINDSEEALNEPYIAQEMIGSFGPYNVPEGHYFMLGDNRNYSRDSRFWENTYVSEDKILGRALFRYSPKIGSIENNHPVY